jgi:superfamily II DNA or RNA helicase
VNLDVCGFELTDWQRDAVDAWCAGDDGRPWRGTIEVVTGGGKSLIALACAAAVARTEPDLKVAVVVPTQALAAQWVEVLSRHTNLAKSDIGVLGAGRKDDLRGRRALVAVLNSAASSLPTIAEEAGGPLMLIVDECHRAGAPKFKRVLETRAGFRLGLSATPDREELGDDGERLTYDEQAVGLGLGGVVFSFGLKEARLAGWLPVFKLHHHAVTLLPEERSRYEAMSRQVDDAADEIRALGGETARARQQAARGAQDLAVASRRWVTLTAQRKDLLYRASERGRVAGRIAVQLFDRVDVFPRMLLFHERVDGAERLWRYLTDALPHVHVVLEHSRLSARMRRQALADFASGRAPILVSVKSLIEGIDVPAADTGVSVASSASVRQRVQALGRVLRRAQDGGDKVAEMHLLYVHDTVDDLIYGKTNWADLTGDRANHYWLWGADASEPQQQEGPPRSPKPTEAEAWSAMGEEVGAPRPWPGEFAGQEYSVSTAGVVHNSWGSLIANPQDAADLVAVLRGREGGRFRVTPEFRLMLVWEPSRGSDPGGPWLVGRLAEPFRVAEEVTSDEVESGHLKLTPGGAYTGPTDKSNGTFKLSQRGAGMVERSVKGGKVFASASGGSVGAANARAVLAAWDELGRPASRFFVNDLWHAWFEAGGERRFLAEVTGGFEFPTDEE